MTGSVAKMCSRVVTARNARLPSLSERVELRLAAIILVASFPVLLPQTLSAHLRHTTVHSKKGVCEAPLGGHYVQGRRHREDRH